MEQLTNSENKKGSPHKPQVSADRNIFKQKTNVR